MAATRRRWGCLCVALMGLSLGGAWLVGAIKQARMAALRSADL